MTRIVTVHSFRRGTGKSTLLSNVATLMAMQGLRVGIVDVNFQAPSMFVFFSLGEDELKYSLNDYLWGNCDIEEAAHDLTPRLRLGVAIDGRLLLVSASPRNSEIARVLMGGYYVDLLGSGIHELSERLNLDVVLIDTNAGVNEETMLAIALANSVLIMLHPDQQDYEGTGIIVDVARRLEVAQLLLVANEVPATFALEQVKSQLAQSYQCHVAAVLPYSEEIMGLASRGIFVLRYPQHPITETFKQITAGLLAD